MRYLVLITGVGVMSAVAFVHLCLPLDLASGSDLHGTLGRIAGWTAIAFLLACVRGACRARRARVAWLALHESDACSLTRDSMRSY